MEEIESRLLNLEADIDTLGSAFESPKYREHSVEEVLANLRALIEWIKIENLRALIEWINKSQEQELTVYFPRRLFRRIHILLSSIEEPESLEFINRRWRMIRESVRRIVDNSDSLQMPEVCATNGCVNGCDVESTFETCRGCWFDWCQDEFVACSTEGCEVKECPECWEQNATVHMQAREMCWDCAILCERCGNKSWSIESYGGYYCDECAPTCTGCKDVMVREVSQETGLPSFGPTFECRHGSWCHGCSTSVVLVRGSGFTRYVVCQDCHDRSKAGCLLCGVPCENYLDYCECRFCSAECHIAMGLCHPDYNI
jgi:hypothetical protein